MWGMAVAGVVWGTLLKKYSFIKKFAGFLVIVHFSGNFFIIILNFLCFFIII